MTLRTTSLAAFLTLAFICNAPAHGPGAHRHKAEDEHDRDHPTEESGSGKSINSSHNHEESRRWGASLAAGWESRHIHYGVNETGNSGAYTTELSFWYQNLMLGAWSGFGAGNAFEEWDFTISYNLDLGAVFLIPGFNFRYSPGLVEEGHSEGEEEHDDHEGHDQEELKEETHSHVHNTCGNEVFFVLGTDRIPYVTPSMFFIWDLNNTPGAFMELRLDGDVPVWKNVFSLQPYALLGLNFGYNTQDYFGWNNVQFGVEATWKINKAVSVFGGVNYSIALAALEDIGQGNEVWANAGVSLTY